MTKSKYKQPLESFDPRMMQLLLRGATTRTNIPFLGPNGKKLAVQFQRRLQTLRARMRDENHDQARNVSRCVVRLLWGSRALEENLGNLFVIGELTDIQKDLLRLDNLGRIGAIVSIQPTDLQFNDVLSSLNLDAAMQAPIDASEDQTLSLEDILGELPLEGEK